MSAIRILSTQPWVERLGWTLLHFLWQGLLLAGLYRAARLGVARSRPQARYLAACLTLAAMLVAPIVTFLCLGPAAEPAPPPDATARVLQVMPQPGGAVVALPAFPLTEHSSAWISQAAPWIVALWLCGAILFWFRLAGAWWAAGRMRSRHIRLAPPEWRQTFSRLCARTGLSRPVRLLVSARVDVPMVVGCLRPVILVPLGALTGLPAEQIEALLLHELAHIARRDYLVNALQSLAEALLFYHPAVWWVSGHIRVEREMCCDDLAVTATGDAFTYAVALAGLETCRPIHAGSAVASNGGSLQDRIARILGQPQPELRSFSIAGVAAGGLLLSMTACVVLAQSADRPSYEVASVKPAPKGLSYSSLRTLPGGRLHAENLTVSDLIISAWRLQHFQITGGPAWIHDVGFNIEAKGDANATRPEMLKMLQPLLEDRFQLKFHRETRELPVYALTLQHGGEKLPAPKEGGCIKPDPAAPPSPPSASGPGSRPPCGSLNMWVVPAGMRLHGGDVPMSEIIRTLSTILGRPVLDRTAFTAHVDVDFIFKPDETTEGLMMSNGAVAGHRETIAAAAGASGPTAAPNLPTALAEQLGLKLGSAKGPVEVIVIDQVEKPSRN